MRRPTVLLGAFVLFLASCGQPASPVVVEREMQVDWGQVVYQYECARCHAPNRAATELTAEVLLQYGNAEALFEFIRAAMPLDRPGVLPEGDYWAVTAYLLAEGDMLTLPPEVRLGEDNAVDVDFMPRTPGRSP